VVNVLLILCGVVLSPFLIFILVKTATYAFFKGKQKFFEETKDVES